MNKNYRGSFGRTEPSGVMDTFAVRLATPVKQPSASILNNKGEGGQFIHEAEDFVVFLPVGYKTPVVPQQGALAAALFFYSRPLFWGHDRGKAAPPFQKLRTGKRVTIPE